MSSGANIGKVGAEKKVRKIIFAGGGTAGHVEPAIAVARSWKDRHVGDKCIFIGTDFGLEKALVPAAGFELRTIEKVAFPRNLGPGIITLPLRLMRAVKSAREVLKGADLLLGFGGYESASTYLAAKLENVPFVVPEAYPKPEWPNVLGAYLAAYAEIPLRTRTA